MLKVPFEWLKEYVPVRLAPEALAAKLTMAGFEVTGIESAEGGPVFSFEITPNRADCLSVIGLAREVAAITGATLRLPRAAAGGRPGARDISAEFGVRSSKGPGRPKVSLRTSNSELRTWLPRPAPLAPRPRISIEDREGCRLYVGRLLEQVRIGPSPEWMQRRLLACGLRPINNVVDVTNYVLLETGQPLHAFDYDRLTGGQIRVRRAAAGEKLVTIDGQACALSPEMLVIADARVPVAVAGVMGGRDSAVAEATTRVLLESAWFEPVRVRRAARALGLSSESSYRFERGVDAQGTEPASERAAKLLVELGQGRLTAVARAGSAAGAKTRISLEPDRVRRLLGTTMKPAAIGRMLRALGCAVKSTAGGLRVEPPSFRRDLRRDVDLIEEIARLAGYDRLPQSPPPASSGADPATAASYELTDALRRLCAALGLREIMTWSLVSSEELAKLGAPAAVALVNPLSRDQAVLRPGLLLGMLRTLARNASQGGRDAALFELGHVFLPEAGGCREVPRLSIGLAGNWEQHWQGRQPTGLFRLKGVIEQLVQRSAGTALAAEAVGASWAEPGRSMQLTVDGRPLGVAAEVRTGLRQAFDLEKPVWFAELDVGLLLSLGKPPVSAAAPSPFPPVKRDLSILVDKPTSFESLRRIIESAGRPLAAKSELIDRYADRPPVPDGKQSLTFSIEYRDPSRTLTAEEADAAHRQICEALNQQVGAQLR